MQSIYVYKPFYTGVDLSKILEEQTQILGWEKCGKNWYAWAFLKHWGVCAWAAPSLRICLFMSRFASMYSNWTCQSMPKLFHWALYSHSWNFLGFFTNSLPRYVEIFLEFSAD